MIYETTAIISPITISLVSLCLLALYLLFQKHSHSSLTRPRPSIAIPNILLQIFPLLSRADLARCCLANRLFFDLACRELYGSRDGVLAGVERFYVWSGDVVSPPKYVVISKNKRSLLAGRDRPIETDTTNPEIMGIVYLLHLEIPPHYNFRPFHPSPLKLHLLRRVTHLVYVTDKRKEYDTLDSTGWFPALETLTIQVVQPQYAKPSWSQSFLANLRPRHIRITQLCALDKQYGATLPFLLDSTLGSRVEKVTIHFLDCDMNEDDRATAVKVEWPVSLKRIDLVFLAPITDTRTRPIERVPLLDFSHTHPPPIIPSKLDEVARTVAALLISAKELNPIIRIVGMSAIEAVHVAAGMAREEDEAKTFPRRLKLFYCLGLERGGMVRGAAEIRAFGLGFTTMEEYKQERDYAPFA